MSYTCVVLSGISGAGKSTIGKLICDEVDNMNFIEGDNYFLAVKPKIKLSSGDIATNWDSEDSIDWDRLNKDVKLQLKKSHVLLATFIPIMDRYTFDVKFHIRLVMGNKYESIARSIENRIISKRITTDERKKKDSLVVKEMVWPLYEKLSQKYEAYEINIYTKEGKRRTKVDIVSDILKIIT